MTRWPVGVLSESETSLVSFVAPVETDTGESRVLVVQTDLNALAGNLP